jgi:hypothetical protein
MNYIVCLLALLPAVALADVTLRPGECVMVHQTRVCAAREHVQRTTVVYMPPAPTPAPRSSCACLYGTHDTGSDAPMRGFWVMRGQDPVMNFLADSASCMKAAATLLTCTQ